MDFFKDTGWHFYVMTLASLIVFIVIIRIILPKPEFSQKKKLIWLLSAIVVVGGMFFGKSGTTIGLPWWIYYTVPMMATVLLPPIVLKLNVKRTILYLFLSFLSAPFIHIIFSFMLGWQEYMPFWNVPYWKSLVQ